MGNDRENHFERGAGQCRLSVERFNAGQWSGVSLIVGAGALLATFASRLGLLSGFGKTDLLPFIPLTALGSALVNMGRQRTTDPAPELAARRHRWMLIVITTCAALFSAAILIDIARSL